MTSQSVEFLVGRFRRRLVRHGEDDRPAVRPAVELHALARLDIGIVALAVAPARLLAVNDRPAQAALLW